MSSAFILRCENGRLSLHRNAKGEVEWKTDKFSVKAAEDEASRARFRSDRGVTYCVYAGVFYGLAEVNNFMELVNRGRTFEQAWRLIERSRVDASA